jgi:hypothetical protein
MVYHLNNLSDVQKDVVVHQRTLWQNPILIVATVILSNQSPQLLIKYPQRQQVAAITIMTQGNLA